MTSQLPEIIFENPGFLIQSIQDNVHAMIKLEEILASSGLLGKCAKIATCNK